MYQLSANILKPLNQFADTNICTPKLTLDCRSCNTETAGVKRSADIRDGEQNQIGICI